MGRACKAPQPRAGPLASKAGQPLSRVRVEDTAVGQGAAQAGGHRASPAASNKPECPGSVLPLGQHRTGVQACSTIQGYRGPVVLPGFSGVLRGAPRRWKLLPTTKAKVATLGRHPCCCWEQDRQGLQGGPPGLKPLYSCPQHLLQGLANGKCHEWDRDRESCPRTPTRPPSLAKGPNDQLGLQPSGLTAVGLPVSLGGVAPISLPSTSPEPRPVPQAQQSPANAL